MTIFNNIFIIDFEVVPKGDLYHIGAVFKDKIFERKDIKDVKAALNELSEFSKDADYNNLKVESWELPIIEILHKKI